MAEFGAAATVSLEVPDSELRAARRKIESELGDLEVDVTASAAGGGASSRSVAGSGDLDRQLATTNDVLDDLDELAIERNNLLKELVDETEQGNRMRARGRGGGFGMMGGGLLALLGVAGGAGALGLTGLADALKNFDPEIPSELPLVDVPDGVPLTGVPDSIPVDAPDDIPVNAPDSIPVNAPFPIPIPIKLIRNLTTPEPTPEPTPGPSPSPTPGPEPSPSPSPEPTPGGGAGIPEQLVEGPQPSPVAEPVGVPSSRPTAEELDSFDPNELTARPAEEAAPGLSRDAAAVGAGGGIAAGLTAGASRLLPGPNASPTPGRLGLPLPALPALALQTERGRKFFDDLEKRLPETNSSTSRPTTMSTSPFVSIGGRGGGGGGGGGDTGSAPGNRSTTRRHVTNVEFNVDARDSRDTKQVVLKVQRKVNELEQRLQEIDNAGRNGGSLTR